MYLINFLFSLKKCEQLFTLSLNKFYLKSQELIIEIKDKSKFY